jgi:uncharacterized protein YecE (DUF72 family)
MANLRIGTCSWKFPSWAGIVYSAPRGINYLQEYATQYNTVEIDQWFWSLFGTDKIRLPDRTDASEYRQSVPDDFRFAVKAPNSITLTHLYKKGRSAPLVANPYFLSPELFYDFLVLIEPLHDTLGPLMFQFEYLNRHKMTSHSHFLQLVETFARALPAPHQYALETRNAQYLNRAHFEFLSRSHLIPVFLQGYWMPPIVETYGAWRSLVIEQPAVVIRLHGPDRESIEEKTGKQWDQIAIARDDELSAIADMVNDLLSEGLDVYVNVNNHYEGSAPLTIGRLRPLL